jgi:hypothetical protein
MPTPLARGHFLRSRGRPSARPSFCAAVLLAALAAGCDHPGTGEKGPAVPGAGSPVLLFSSGNQGVLAACGCPSNPSGGLAKRQALVERYRLARSATILVDAGDLFPPADQPNAVKVKYVALALARAGYDAIALGDQEWALGLPQLRRLAEEHKLPFLCANVRDENAEPLFQPHIIREVGGVRVGLFAVMADEAFGFPVVEWRKGLKVEPPVDAARREVAELSKSCDLIVAVSHQRLLDTRDLAGQVPGIDVVISGHDERVLLKPEKIGETLLVAAGDEGRILGALAITRPAAGRPALAFQMTELAAQVPDAKWVMDLYWEYVKEAKDAPPPDWQYTPVPSAYEPSEACGKCHKAEYDQWLTTRHAHAYASIKRVGRQDDPECILCHTMGLGRKGGFVSMAETPDLGRVTCQACHGFTCAECPRAVGKDPKRDPRIAIASRMCMSCHGPIQSPKFDFYVYKPQIVHKPAPASEKK